MQNVLHEIKVNTIILCWFFCFDITRQGASRQLHRATTCLNPALALVTVYAASIQNYSKNLLFRENLINKDGSKEIVIM